MVNRIKETNIDFTAITPESVTSLYLYGTLQTPTKFYDRIKTKDYWDSLPTTPLSSTKIINLKIDAVNYMSSGPGRFAKPAEFLLVQKFFDGVSTIGMAPGEYTFEEISNFVSGGAIRNSAVIEHVGRNDGNDNGIDRPYIYNNSSYKLNGTFVIGDGERYIKNAQVRAFDDNFDFVGGSLLSFFFNQAVKSKIDPFNIGTRVEFDFNNNSNPIDAKYDLTDFDNDTSFINNTSNQVASTAAISAMVTRLENAGIVEYNKDGFDIVYGSFEDQTFVPNDNTVKTLILAGEGIDILNGGANDDRLYGHEGDDDLRGNAGDDRLFGGTGADRLDGGDGDDVLFGDISDEDFLGSEEQSPNPTGSFDDELRGGAGKDRLDGGAGNDVLSGGDDKEQDLLLGGDDNDTFEVAQNDIVLDSDPSDILKVRDPENGAYTQFMPRIAIDTEFDFPVTRQVLLGHRASFESFDSEDGPELEDINFLINTGSTLFIINYDGTGVAVLDYQADDMGLDIKAGNAYMAEVKDQYPLVDVSNVGEPTERYDFSLYTKVLGSLITLESQIAAAVSADDGTTVNIEIRNDSFQAFFQTAIDAAAAARSSLSSGAALQEKGAAGVALAENNNLVTQALTLPTTFDFTGTNDLDFLRGTAADETFLGGGGADILIGDAGSDTYYYSIGDGFDSLLEFGSDADTDILVLSDLSLGDVDIRAVGQDLIIERLVVDQQSSLTPGEIFVANQFFSETPGAGIEEIHFADGTVWNRSQIETETGVTPNSYATFVFDKDFGAVASASPVTFDIANDYASDFDQDTIFVINVSATNGQVVANGDGTITYTANPGFVGQDRISISISDDFADTLLNSSPSIKSAQFTITVTGNTAPILQTPIVEQRSLEDAIWNFTVPADTFVDPEADSLTFSASLADGQPLPGWIFFDEIAGSFFGIPPQNFNGTIDLRVTASDGMFDVVSDFSLVIEPENDAPVAGSINLGSMNEDETITVTQAQLLAQSSDIEGDALSVVNVSVDASLGTVTDNGNATWTFAPAADFNGADVALAFTISDGSLPDFSEAFIDVVAVNDAPVVDTAIADQTLDEDTTWNFVVPANTFSDVDGDTLSLSASLGDGTTLPTWLLFDGITGTFSGTPPTDFNGTVNLRVTASDSSAQVSSDFSLDVTPVNDAPVAGAVDLEVIDEDGALTITQAQLLAQSSDPDGDALSVTGVSVDAALGTVTDNGDATWTFSPVTNFNGNDIAISFTISDGTLQDTAQALIDVTAVNDAPVVNTAIADQSSDEDNAWSFPLPTDTFTDVDGDVLTLSATLADGSALPTWLSFDGPTKTFSGTPPQNFNGVIDLRVTASDGTLQVSSSFALNINPVNDNPVAADDTGFETDQDTLLNISASLLLGNDSDIDGDSISIISVSNALNGSVSLAADGTVSFTPGAGYTGVASFDYTITDGNGGTDTAVVSLQVNETNGATQGDDVLIGTPGIDVIDGLGGNDDIRGLAGNDQLLGGLGDDSLRGNQGDDVLTGGEGADFLRGGQGFDIADYSNATSGVAVAFQKVDWFGIGGEYRWQDAGGLDGEADGDQFRSIEGFQGSDFNDYVYGARQGTTADLGAGDDVFDTRWWRSGVDVVNAGDGNDQVWTGAGNDVINGGAGEDQLHGEWGNDIISGGTGNDWLSGGFGQDTFIFADGDGTDTITDFQPGWSFWNWSLPQDTIKLDVEGFNSFADILSNATQQGSWWNATTTIDFGGDDKLVLENTALWQLNSDAFEFV